MNFIRAHNSLSAQLVLITLLMVPLGSTAAEPPSDPTALYRDVLAAVRAADAFSVHVEKQFDVVMPDGAKVQYSGALDILAKKEGALHMNYGDDVSAKELWYDGSSVTLIDHLSNVYAEVPAQGKVGAMLVDVNARYGLELPLAPLLSRGPEDFADAVESTTYLGLHDAGGEPCHHMLYRGANVDLQAWITTGDAPLLRKMVVTFWQIQGAPQQALEFSDWNLRPRFSSRRFAPDIPEGAIRTEFLPLEGE
jgi:hypothetical protein